MAKLYLVRRNLEVFTGPMTLVEMHEAYKHMQFGLQDEVAGHCGPWVTFENLERIKKQYPEVARIVYEEMMAGWNVGSDSEGKLINEDTKRLAIKSVRGISLAVFFLVIAVAAFVAALYMASSGKAAVKGKEQQESALRPRDLQDMLERRDNVGFDRYMELHGGELVAQISQRQVVEESWLPYLRQFAFAHDGQFAGLNPKYLRGSATAAAPVDCSLQIWRRRWRSSSKDWNDLLVGHELVRAHWARLMAWDPYWIKRREHTGWIGAQNYYTACLSMADKALTEVGAELVKITPTDEWDKLGYARLKARLAWLQVSLKGTAVGAVAAMPEAAMVLVNDSSSVALWTCFEAATDLGALTGCRRGMGGEKDTTWQAYNEERYGWNLLRLAASTHGTLSADMRGLMLRLGPKINKEDHFTRFDYRPEASLFLVLMRSGIPAEKVVEKAQTEFPTIKLSH